MRFKAIPPPPSAIDALEDAWRAVPLVPADEDDCCRRLAARLDRHDLDEARQWVALLRALGLIEVTARGFVRTRQFPSMATIRGRYRERVFLVDELIGHLEVAGETDVTDAFEAVGSHVPPWERHRHPGRWRELWTRRTEALLEWGVLLGQFDRSNGRFALATG